MGKLNEITFCFVDIETTGSKPNNSQIIELGAVKYRFGAHYKKRFEGSAFEIGGGFDNCCILGSDHSSFGNHKGEILGAFQSLIKASQIPPVVSELTGISTGMLKHAPSEKAALLAFLDFLEDSVFVAHNVNFDYGFINQRLAIHGLDLLNNYRICTHECAKTHILSRKKSLAFLNSFFGINMSKLHRAYSDALCCMRVFEIISLPIILGCDTFVEFMQRIKNGI